MNIKEAIKILKQPPDFSLRYYERENAIDIVLNELDKKDRQIEEAYKEGYKKGALPQVLENWHNENARIVKINKIEDKKDKVIENMLDYIDKPYRITILGGKTREKLKKYFEEK